MIPIVRGRYVNWFCCTEDGCRLLNDGLFESTWTSAKFSTRRESNRLSTKAATDQPPSVTPARSEAKLVAGSA